MFKRVNMYTVVVGQPVALGWGRCLVLTWWHALLPVLAHLGWGTPPCSLFRPPYSHILPSHCAALVDCNVESSVGEDSWLSATISAPHESIII
jgi:hypothetical protein